MTRPMLNALRLGIKTQTRRVIHQANTGLTGGKWAGLDTASLRPCHPSTEYALSGRCDMGTSGAHTVGVFSHVRVGDVFWIKHAGNGRTSARDSMVVTAITPSRLHEIDDKGAIAEGVAVFGLIVQDMRDVKGDPLYGNGYLELFRELTPTGKRVWADTEIHSLVQNYGASPRDCFALLWAVQYGPGGWLANPWVWCYSFAYFPQTPELAALNRGP